MPPKAAPKTTESGQKLTRGWDAQSHEDLLLCFIDEFKPGKPVLQSITERMKDQGYSYSYDAVK